MKREGRKQESGISRRSFIAGGMGAVAAAGLAGGSSLLGAENGRFLPFPGSKLQTRPFGDTGARVSLMTFGGGGPWVSPGDDVALRVLNTALDAGVNCIDTAYGYGRSEELIGTLMPERRGDVLLHTKISTRNKDQWWSHLETSLRRLRVEYVDTLMIHHLGGDDDLEKLEAPGGAFDLLRRAKEQKLARWIGVSAHTNSRTLVRAVSRHELDHVMVSLNVATGDYSDMGFEEVALPELRRRGIAVTAMKAMGAGKIVREHPEFDYRTCIRYTLSLPQVPTVTITNPSLDLLFRNIEATGEFEPLSEKEMSALKKKAAREVRTSFYDFMRTHTDRA